MADLNSYAETTQPFYKAIASLPWYDDSARVVFADWLDEHGFHDEADRQRKYVPSCRWLKDFAERHSDFKTYSFSPEYADTIFDTDTGLGRLLAFLQAHTEEDVGDEDEDGNVLRDCHVVLGFDTPYFTDYSEELWEHFEIVTATKAPQGIYRTRRPNFRCTC